jgi:hypothetical protein
MNFKEWLKTEVVKARPKNIDISNLAIGRIGPAGTFGQDDPQSTASWAAASTLGALGQGIRMGLGSLGQDAHHRLIPLSMLKDVYRDGMELPLQIPSLDGQQYEFNIARSSDKLVISSILQNIKGNPIENPKVRKPKETNPEMPNKFQLVDPDDKDQGKVEIAKKFTEGLIKVIIMYKLMQQKTVTGTPLYKIYDVQNPKVVSKFYNNKHLAMVLAYNKLQNVSDDMGNDYTETDPENNNQSDVIKRLLSGEEIKMTSEEISKLLFRSTGDGTGVSELPELGSKKFKVNSNNGIYYVKLL